MKITEKESEGIWIISISGRFTMDCIEGFRKKLAETMLKRKRIVLNLAEMEYIDGSGLTLFCSYQRRIKESGGSLILACMQAGPRVVFNVTKTFKIFNIYNTLDSAIAASKV